VTGYVVFGARSFDEVASTTYTTLAAQQKTVVLRDGTRIMLAPQTTITVPTDVGARTRTIALSGEAYFDVASATDHPFMVRAHNVTIRVLGTAFDVRGYRTDSVVQVAVRSGRVSASGRGTPVTLSEGMVARLSDSTIVVSRNDPRVYTSWTQGQLIFEHTPIPSMLKTLGQWYGYDFQLTDSVLASQSVSASFSVSDSVEMLASLKTMLGVDMTFHGNVITLVSRRTSHEGVVRKTLVHRSLEVGK